MDYSNFQFLFGLIGYPLSHSFSKKHFSQKFANEGRDHCFYELFPLERIEAFPQLLNQHPNLLGINVTIPYKEQVIPYLSELDPAAQEIGAVNTIKIIDGKLTGYNTDSYGFERSLIEKMEKHQLSAKKALVLGTGGAAKAVLYVLKKLNIEPLTVSRNSAKGDLTYQDLNAENIQDYQLLVNTTPLGMSPNIDSCPTLPYTALNYQHLLYDLVYNPAETLFMKKGKAAGAYTINGLQMLILQAEGAWNIWTKGIKDIRK